MKIKKGWLYIPHEVLYDAEPFFVLNTVSKGGFICKFELFEYKGEYYICDTSFGKARFSDIMVIKDFLRAFETYIDAKELDKVPRSILDNLYKIAMAEEV